MSFHAWPRHKLPVADVTRKLGVRMFRLRLLRWVNIVNTFQMSNQAAPLCILLATDVTRELSVRIFWPLWWFRLRCVNAMHISLVLDDVIFCGIFHTTDIAQMCSRAMLCKRSPTTKMCLASMPCYLGFRCALPTTNATFVIRDLALFRWSRSWKYTVHM